jgi:hypothetical protein
VMKNELMENYTINYNLIILNMMGKKLLIVSAAIVLFLAGSVLGHKEAVDDEELAEKVVNEAVNQANQDEEFLENLKVGPIGPEVYTGPKDFAYCNLSQKI